MIGGEVAYSIARIMGPALGVKVRPRRPIGGVLPTVDSQVASVEALWPDRVVAGDPVH